MKPAISARRPAPSRIGESGGSTWASGAYRANTARLSLAFMPAAKADSTARTESSAAAERTAGSAVAAAGGASDFGEQAAAARASPARNQRRMGQLRCLRVRRLARAEDTRPPEARHRPARITFATDREVSPIHSMPDIGYRIDR